MVESAEERWAVAAVCRVVGATSETHDHSGRARAVDYLLRMPDGSVAALEVTSHAQPGIREMGSLLAQEGYRWDNPGRWQWSIAFEPSASIKKVREIYAHVIAACEQHGVRSPDELPFPLLIQDDVLWGAAFEELGVRFYGSVSSICTTGTLAVLPGSMGGGVDEALTNLPASITELLAVRHVSEHIDKLLDHQANERHLFVTLGPGAIPFPQYYPLCSRVTALPSVSPSVASGITHLWFSTGWGPSLIGWSVRGGWQAADVFDKHSPAASLS